MSDNNKNLIAEVSTNILDRLKINPYPSSSLAQMLLDCTTTTTHLQTNSFGTGASTWIEMNTARGTVSSPLANVTSDVLVNISFGGNDGTTELHPGLIAATVNGPVSTGVIPTDMAIYAMMADGAFSNLTLSAGGYLSYTAGLSGGPAEFRITGGSGALNTLKFLNGSGAIIYGSDQSNANLYLKANTPANGLVYLGSTLNVADGGQLTDTGITIASGNLWAVQGTIPSGGNLAYNFAANANSQPNSLGLQFVLSGSNGNRYHYAILGQTSTTGTGNDLYNGFGNYGLNGAATGATSGLNVGLSGWAVSGAKSVGVWGGAPGAENTQSTNSTYVGGLFTALNTQSGSHYIGAHVLLTGPTGSAAYAPPAVNVGLLVDNATTGADLQYWYNNGSQAAKIDSSGNLRLSGNLGVGNSVSATVPGAVVKKIEVFDASGTSLGFIPVYSSIT